MALRICTLVLVDLRCSSLFSFPKYKFSTILRSAKYLSGLPHVFRARSLSSKPQSKIITIPNILTSLRIAATPLIVSLILHHELASAATLTVVAGLTDVADGYIARRFPTQQSVVGTYLDPLADKLFVSFLAVALAYTDLFPGMPYLLSVLLMCAMFLSDHRLIAPKERIIEMKPISSSKLNTALQITAVVSSLLAPVLNLQDSFALPVLWLLAGGTTVYSGIGYVQIFPRVYQEALHISASKLKQ